MKKIKLRFDLNLDFKSFWIRFKNLANRFWACDSILFNS